MAIIASMSCVEVSESDWEPGESGVGGQGDTDPERSLERQAILRGAIGIGLYAGAFGMAFGATSVTAGLSLWQTMLLSLMMFTGASQFAFVGVIAAGGSPFAAVGPALLLGLRNAFYGVPMSAILRPSGIAKLWTAHFVIDETTAMTVAQPDPALGRYAFWSTGVLLCLLWAVGSLAGALLGKAVNPSDFGLDAAAPAIFIALLYPQLRRPGAPAVALVGAVVALALVPFVPAGVPVIAAAAVAVAAGLRSRDEVDLDDVGGPGEFGEPHESRQSHDHCEPHDHRDPHEPLEHAEEGI